MAEQTQTNITAYGRPKSSREGGSTVINYTVNGGGYGSSNINARSATINRIKSELIDTNILNAGTGNFVYLVATDGTISTLRGTDLNYQSGYIDELQASKIKAHELTMNEPNDIAKITTIFNEYLQGKEIVTDYLTVNKAAHFFEVVIDKIKSVGGTIINTACNSTIDYVQGLDANDELTDNPIKYRCYFKRTQDDGTHITNDWEVNDQAICQACNLVPGTSYNKGTHYYWRLVKDKNDENTPVYVNFNTGEVDDESTTQPDYFVVFTHQENSNVIFTYDKTIGTNGQGKPVKKTVTGYTSTGDIVTDKEEDALHNIKLKIEDTIHGLNVVPNEENVGTSYDADGTPTTITQKPVMIGGGDATFSFATETTINGTKIGGPTRLNVAFVFDDGTIEFHPIGSIIEEYNTNHVGDQNYTALNPDTDYLTEYSVGVISEKNINFISITSDEVNVWNSCHYVDLSNEQGEYDVPTHLDGNNYDMAPVAGDNIVQLGYRYTELSSADLANLGYDSSSTDAAGQSLTTEYNDAVDKQAWKNAHVDEVSRASAIIIAAYKTPDGGGTLNGRVIQPIIPPSYAQYQNITDFNLYIHRGTYMDASGGYFKGNLVSESGDIINIDDQLSVDVDYYGLICSESPVTKPSTGSKNINFSVLHVYNGVGTIMSNSELSNWYIIVNNGNEISAQSGVFSYTVNASTPSSLNVKLYDPDDAMKDNIIVSVISLEDVTDGVNGGYTDFVYHGSSSSLTAPTLPSNVNSSWDVMSSTEKKGWSKDTPTGYKYVWMTQRDNIGTQGGWTYGNWTTATRITGEDGQAGTDGKDFEFIYTLSQISSTEVDNPAWTPNITEPADHTIDDYTPVPWSYTLNGVTYTGDWEDHPQGISSDYMYEYMAQRYSYTQNNTKYWSNFSTPVIWSKWGEKGMDGDGYEYIFKLYTQSTLPSSAYPTYADYGGKTFTNDDFVPSGWNDDPLSPTSNRSYCFVSQRRQKNGQWILPTDSVEGTPWSTPTLWARYSKDGTDGTNGTDGTDGDNGVVDKLVPYTALFEVRTTSTDDYSDIVSKLYANLQYQVWHADGDVVSQVTGTALNSYSIRGTVRAANKDILTYNLVASTGQDGFMLNNNMFKLYDGSNYYMTNMLDHLGYPPSAVYHDYRKLSQSSTLAGKYLPIEIQVELLYNNQVVDSKVHEVIFKAGHVFEVTDAALNSAFFGSWTKDGETVNGMSQIHQDMQGISTNVSTLSNNLGTLQSDYSSFKETATQFQTKVNSYYFDSSSYQPIFTWSEINQTASDISFSVQSDIEGKLIKTGININNNVISLDSANTTIGGDVYIHNGSLISDGVDKETSGMVRTESTVSTSAGSMSTTPVEFKTFVAGDVFRVSDLFVEYYNTKTGVFSEEHITTGCTFYIKKGTGTAQSITTSTSITFTNSTAGTYSFYATYNNLPADCILYGFMDYTSTASSVTEIASNGINIADNNDYMRFDTSAQKFYVETRYQKGNADERGMSMKIDNGPIMTRLLNQEPGSIISGGLYPNDLNHPTYSTLAATSSGNIGWGTTNAQLSIARYNNTSTANTVYIYSDVDVYIFTSNTINTTFYIGGVHNDTSKGLVNGRQIWIKGHPKLTVDPTNYDNYPNEAHTIMLKSQYWNNTSVGSKTMSSSNGYSWHLVYYYGTWIEI